MKRFFTLTAILSMLALPLGALAMSHEKDDHGSMDSMGSMNGDMDGGMSMKGDMIMLGEKTEDGVKAMVHLKDVKDAMAKMGMSETHHFMVMFMDTESGEPVESGLAAVKIEGPDDYTAGPIKLMGMQGHFGADITLPEKGKYEFKVGTKLSDGQKRQYEFEYDYK